MAHKVLHREWEEAMRARDALLHAQVHVEDQLQQLNVIIMLKEAELRIQEKMEKGEKPAS
jgi:hypothetical protein